MNCIIAPKRMQYQWNPAALAEEAGTTSKPDKIILQIWGKLQGRI